jgi:spore maturation protein CgeB
MLRQSLEALGRRDPELCERICWPVESDHVVLEESGDVTYRLHQGRYRLSLDPDAVDSALPAADPAPRTIFVFGVGLGEQVDALLSSTHPETAIVAWERDPWLVRLALGRNDWSRDLASGRLRLLMGSDLVEALRDGGAPPAPIVFHPFLSIVYRNEKALLDGAAARPLALLCAGGLFADDLAAALTAAGFAIYTVDVRRLSEDELARTVRRLRPAVIAAINYTEGLAEFAAAHRCKLLCWEIDPATSALPPCRTDTDDAFIFTYRRANVDEFRAAGFVHAEYLPLATDPRRRAPILLTDADRERYGAPVSFVGSSMLPQSEGFRQAFLAGLTGMATTADATAVLDEILAEQRRDFSRYAIPDALVRRCAELGRADPRRLATLARLAGELAAAEKRLAYVSRLGPAGIRVWGDEGWRAAEPSGASYRGPAGHAVELTKIYGATLINLDVGRLYQDDIVPMRVFDVLACGGFVLVERSPALAELFEIGVEVDCYGSADELEAKVAFYLAAPERARAIALLGQQAVRRRHDIAGRVRHMLAVSGLNGAQVGV